MAAADHAGPDGDLYQLLGVSREASREEIALAWRRPAGGCGGGGPVGPRAGGGGGGAGAGAGGAWGGGGGGAGGGGGGGPPRVLPPGHGEAGRDLRADRRRAEPGRHPPGPGAAGGD